MFECLLCDKMEYQYNKKSIWRWVLLYTVMGAVVYGLIFYLSYPKYWGYNNNSRTINYKSQNYKNETKDNCTSFPLNMCGLKVNNVNYDKSGIYFNDAQNYQINYLAGTELQEILNYNKYCSTLFYKNGHITIASFKD